MRSHAAAFAGCLVLSTVGLFGLASPFDPAAVRVLWQTAEQHSPDDLAGDAWLDVAKQCARSRPWREEYARCHRLLDEIDDARAAGEGGH